MKIEQQQHDGLTIFALVGSLDATSAPEAERSFTGVFENARQQVVLDLTDVEYISSGGIRAIIMLSRNLERNEGILKLCGLNPFVAEVFEMTHLNRIFSIYTAREDAVRAFRQEGCAASAQQDRG